MTDDFGPDYNRTDSDTRAGVLWTDHSECERTIQDLQAEHRRLKEAYEELSNHAYEEADVIKEQKAEIERLRAANEDLDMIAGLRQDEIDRLRAELDECEAENDHLLAVAENEHLMRIHQR